MGTFVTATGLQKPTLQEIKLRLRERMVVLYGPEVDLSEEGPLGMFIGELAKGFSDSWDGLQEVYTSYDPAQATGMSLDIVAAITGIDRIEAARSVANCLAYTDEAHSGAVVPVGKRARRVRGSLEFSLLSDLTISQASCSDIYLELKDTTPGHTVSLTTSFGVFSTTVLATPLATLQALAALINADPWTGTAWAYNGPSTAPLGAQYTDDPTLRLFHPTVNFSTNLTTQFGAFLIGSAGDFECTIDGPEYADPGEIREIATPVSGWLKVYNQVGAIPGRNTETDSELRLRRSQNFAIGYATEDAIRFALLNQVEGVIAATVTSNRTMDVVNGIPPKAFECVVQGGDPDDIGRTIWRTMPAGIESFGNTEVVTPDSQGKEQSAWFTVPVAKYLHVRVTYKVYSDEDFPLDGEAQIAAAIVAWGATEYILGKDAIPNRVLTPVYKVPGIGDASVEVALTDHPTDTPTFSSVTVPVGGRNYALPSTDRVSFLRVV